MLPLRNKRIFIVEDNMLNRVVYHSLLFHQKVEIGYERHGKHTLHTLRAFGKVDLILLDLMLTDGLSGLDIFDQIRQLPEYSNIPIAAVSAADPTESIRQTMKRGFSGFISKPVDDVLFPNQIKDLINGLEVWHDGSMPLPSIGLNRISNREDT